MSAIKKAAEMLRREAESMKECHTVGVGGEWYGDSAKADYDEMIAVAGAAIAERDELRAKLERVEKQRDGLIGTMRVLAARPTVDEGRDNWEAIVWESIGFAEEAIAKATGDQP
jgi:hypothetical protein